MRALRTIMGEREIDVVLLSVGSDLPWLTGYEAMPLERLTMAIVPHDGDVRLVVPELEAPRVDVPADLFEVVAWSENDDAVALVADLAGPVEHAAIGDHTWSRFVLAIQSAMPTTTLHNASPLMSSLRIIKDSQEIELLRTAASAADTVSAALATERFSGRTEHELARAIAEATVAAGHDRAEFTIVASGPNSASPHHEPHLRTMTPGDLVVIDFGGSVAHYCSDTTRTFAVGAPSSEIEKAHGVLEQAQRAGRAAATVGTAAEDVDAATRAVIDDAGYGEFFIHRTGHGIGLDVHEDPYLVSGNSSTLAAGMAFSIEPGIYVPGQWGMRIEDIVVASDEGPDVLNNTTRSLVVVA